MSDNRISAFFEWKKVNRLFKKQEPLDLDLFFSQLLLADKEEQEGYPVFMECVKALQQFSDIIIDEIQNRTKTLPFVLVKHSFSLSCSDNLDTDGLYELSHLDNKTVYDYGSLFASPSVYKGNTENNTVKNEIINNIFDIALDFSSLFENLRDKNKEETKYAFFSTFNNVATLFMSPEKRAFLYGISNGYEHWRAAFCFQNLHYSKQDFVDAIAFFNGENGEYNDTETYYHIAQHFLALAMYFSLITLDFATMLDERLVTLNKNVVFYEKSKQKDLTEILSKERDNIHSATKGVQNYAFRSLLEKMHEQLTNNMLLQTKGIVANAIPLYILTNSFDDLFTAG